MSRHRAPDGDETTIIPRITDEPSGPPVSPAPMSPGAGGPATTPAAPTATGAASGNGRPSPRPPQPAASPWEGPAAADATAIIPAVPATAPFPPAAAEWPQPVPRPATPSPTSVPPAAGPDPDATTTIPRVIDGPRRPDDVPTPDRSAASDADATTTIPRITDGPSPSTLAMAQADATTVIPRIDETTLIGKIPEVPDTDDDEPDREPRTRDDSGAPIRAVRMKDAYASAYSDYTRVTVGSVIRTTLRTTGELLITCGLILLLFAAYELWGKAVIVDSHQSDLSDQLAREWDRPVATAQPSTPTGKQLPPPPGNAISRLYIPRLNKHWVVVEGVSPADIRYAPGHYPKTAMPGEKGNFAIAGHRMRSVFWDLDKLQVGDKIVIETRATWYVYAVVKTRVVRPSQVEVVTPSPPGVLSAVQQTNTNVPPGGETLSEGAFLTLTTCNPKWDNYQRLIIHAALVDTLTRPRAEGPPAEVKG